MSRPGPRCIILYIIKHACLRFENHFRLVGTTSWVGYYACVGELEYITLLLY